MRGCKEGVLEAARPAFSHKDVEAGGATAGTSRLFDFKISRLGSKEANSSSSGPKSYFSSSPRNFVSI